ncbi:chemotaxis protein CheB [Mucilaginibacter sp.]|jgi:two-component system chemotaxis response regulator CheB|uniref:chemotaxis protein CheB n=1 Tax=Mucilaginibacter sp. TaxID=1882438 RepID=UPI003569C1DE
MDGIKNVIVIGASAGGFKAIIQLAAKIPVNIPAAIFVVMHLGKQSMPQVIVQHLQKSAKFICSIPVNGEAIQSGHLYVAPRDSHMLLTKGVIHITKGPHENRWRPSIDVLFRSAAAAYDSRVIGIVLSGMMDDGTSGMSAIKRSGGVCIVQEPLEAEFPDMPRNVLNKVDVDYQVSINDISYILDDLFAKPQGAIHEIPEDIKIEAEITKHMTSSIEDLKKIGKQTDFTCPECGGNLFAMHNDPARRYRCFTGHTYNEKLLVETQAEALEESLWVCIRMLEERKGLLQKIADHAGKDGQSDKELQNSKIADDIVHHIERLKALLVTMNKNSEIVMNDHV